MAGANGKREVPFQAGDFEVEVTFAPAGAAAGKPDKRARAFKLALQPLADAPDDARLATRQFRAELTLDDAAKSPGQSGLPGPYDVDVTITGVKGPLAGARRPSPGCCSRWPRSAKPWCWCWVGRSSWCCW